MNHFDYLTSINDTKKDIMIDDLAEKDYNSFMVNRGLSYFNDTILIANEMNTKHFIDKRMQYDFHMNLVRKKKRWSKWNKAEVDKDLKIVKEYYGYSSGKARQVLSLLTDENIQDLKKRLYKGGKS